MCIHHQLNSRGYATIFTVSGIPNENEAWLAWVMVASRSFAVVCRRVPANCDIRQANTFLFIVSPGIKLQEESVYSKAVVICLYCERFASNFDVDISRNRIDTSIIRCHQSPEKVEPSSLESWMIGDMLSVYGEIKI